MWWVKGGPSDPPGQASAPCVQKHFCLSHFHPEIIPLCPHLNTYPSTNFSITLPKSIATILKFEF